MDKISMRYAPLWLLGLILAASPAAAQQTGTTTTTTARAKKNPLEPALRRSRDSLTYIQSNVQDYTAILVKRQRVNGKLTEQTWANMKVRHRRKQNGRVTVPMSVYLNFLKPASVKGREVIWVEGQNGGKLIAHESGIRNLMNVNLDPKGALAMRGERYPITEVGIENLTMKLVDAAKTEKVHAGCEVRVHKNAKIGDQVCEMFEVTYPKRLADTDFYRTRVFFSKELNMPIRYVSWSWPETSGDDPVLEEEYTYLNVKVNVGLRDLDFDKDNPGYRFW